MSKTPEDIQRTTNLVIGGVALLLFLLFAGVARYQLWHKSNLPRTHEAISATVADVRTACRLEKKVNKNWHQEDILPCDAAAKLVAERSGFTQKWRSVEDKVAVLTYLAGGQAQEILMRAETLSDRPLTVGEKFDLYADRENPKLVEKPMSDDDKATASTMTIIGAVIAILTVLLGRVIAHYNRKSQEKAIAAGGTILPSGYAAFPAGAEPAGTGAVPMWSKVLGWTGTGVLVLGLLTAALAAVGSKEAGSEALTGAAVIAVLSIGIWRLCGYMASIGRP